jgi:hypothetical protein
MEAKFFAVPPAFRYIWYLTWRSIMFKVYEAHKQVVLSRKCRGIRSRLCCVLWGIRSRLGCVRLEGLPLKWFCLYLCAESKLDAWLASEVTGVPAFSTAMALRRLHWKNSLLGEVLYLVNVFKVRPLCPVIFLTSLPSRLNLYFAVMQTGRVHQLPPTKRPMQRPTFLYLF